MSNHHKLVNMPAAVSYIPAGILRFGVGGRYSYASRYDYLQGLGCTSTLTLNYWLQPSVNIMSMVQSIGRHYRPDDSTIGMLRELVLHIDRLWDYAGTFAFAGMWETTAAMAARVPTNGPWSMLTFVKNGVSGRWYLNGRFINAVTATQDLRYRPFASLVGADVRDGSRSFIGNMSVAQVWSYALNDFEVSNLFSQCRPPATLPSPPPPAPKPPRP